MKKFLIVLMIIIGLIFTVLFVLPNPFRIDRMLDYSVSLHSPKIEKIAIEGAEQEVLVRVLQTEKNYSEIHLSGKVSQVVLDEIKHSKVSANSAEITLSGDGFRFVNDSSGKPILNVDIALAKNATFKTIAITMSHGGVTFLVPSDFHGRYRLDTNSIGDIIEVPDTLQIDNSVIDIDAFGDIKIQKYSQQ